MGNNGKWQEKYEERGMRRRQTQDGTEKEHTTGEKAGPAMKTQLFPLQKIKPRNSGHELLFLLVDQLPDFQTQVNKMIK